MVKKTKSKEIKLNKQELDEIEDFVINEFGKLKTCIFRYMDIMHDTGMAKKDVMKITQRDVNYFIKQWNKKQD
tara:strand:+ start:319 stop:537 length:219 start_codon:yes stop_codon:yes gene_type:complete